VLRAAWVILLVALLPTAAPQLAAAAEPVAEPPIAPAATPAATTGRAAVDRGVALLAEDDLRGAIAALEDVDGGLAYEDVLRLKESLGIALAYAGRKQEARQVFADLLAVAPGHALPYTISPKATFVFEAARTEMSRQRAAEFELELPPALPFDEPIEVGLTSRANPLELVRRLQLCHRVKGPRASYACVDVDSLVPDQQRRVVLPAVPASAAAEVDAEAEGEPLLLQLALIGFDGQGNEVYRGPSRARPKEVMVGVEVPGPWYTSPWLWGAVGAVVLAAGVTTTIAVIMLQPTTARLSGQLESAP